MCGRRRAGTPRPPPACEARGEPLSGEATGTIRSADGEPQVDRHPPRGAARRPSKPAKAPARRGGGGNGRTRSRRMKRRPSRSRRRTGRRDARAGGQARIEEVAATPTARTRRCRRGTAGKSPGAGPLGQRPEEAPLAPPLQIVSVVGPLNAAFFMLGDARGAHSITWTNLVLDDQISIGEARRAWPVTSTGFELSGRWVMVVLAVMAGGVAVDGRFRPRPPSPFTRAAATAPGTAARASCSAPIRAPARRACARQALRARAARETGPFVDRRASTGGSVDRRRRPPAARPRAG